MIPIVYEDRYILAVHKPPGIPSQTRSVSQADLMSIVGGYLREKHPEHEPFIGMINRLDQPVEGIVLMALDPETAASLSAHLQSHDMSKKYRAGVVLDELGETDAREGRLTDYISQNKKLNYSCVVKPGSGNAQLAELDYKLIGERTVTGSDGEHRIGLADIGLITGRHHQIRTQMAHAHMPLLGDRKYGTREAHELSDALSIPSVALCAYELSFTHPRSDDIINLRVEPQGEWYGLFTN